MLDRSQEKETGEALESTKIHDAKYDELGDWWSRWVAYAIVALADQTVRLARVTQGDI